MTGLIKGIIVLALIAIVASLASALVFLLKDESRSKRTVTALTVRIAVSVGLFALVLIAMATGVITPNRPFG
jgi:Protein of unknown function (DUF2909).